MLQSITPKLLRGGDIRGIVLVMINYNVMYGNNRINEVSLFLDHFKLFGQSCMTALLLIGTF